MKPMEMDDDVKNALEDNGVDGHAGAAVKGDDNPPTYTLFDMIIVGLYREHYANGPDGNSLEYLIKLGEENGARH